MKNSILAIVVFGMWITSAFAADPAYEQAMKKQIKAMESIQSAEQSQEISNSFLRIAEAQPEEWLPLYYAGLIHIESAFRFEEVQKDQQFDRALELIAEAQKISPDNSELTALQGYALMGKLSVDPASRGQNLSPQVMQLFGKAINQNRENPRAVVLMAQMELGMAQFFGSGPDKACGMARIAEELYQKEEAELQADSILPKWGKRTVGELLKQCN